MKKEIFKILFFAILLIALFSGCVEDEGLVDDTGGNNDNGTVEDTSGDESQFNHTVIAKGYNCSDPVITVDSTNNPHVITYDHINLDVIHTFFNGSEWITEVVDSYGDVGRGDHDIAIDSDDTVHICYRNVSIGGIKYAVKENDEWNFDTIEIPDSTKKVMSCAIEIGSDETPHVVYGIEPVDPDSGILPTIRYAVKNGSNWEIEDLNIKGEKIRMDLDGNDIPHIVAWYYDGLRYITKNSSGEWNLTIIDQDFCYNDPYIVIDSQNHPYVYYQGVSSEDYAEKIAYWNGTAWNIQVVDTNEECIAEHSISIYNDSPYMVYGKPSEGLKLAALKNNEWQYQIVYTARVTSVAIDSLGHVHTVHTAGPDDEHEHIEYVRIDDFP